MELRFLSATAKGFQFGSQNIASLDLHIKALESNMYFLHKVEGEIPLSRAVAIRNSDEYRTRDIKVFKLWLVYYQEADDFGLLLESQTLFKPETDNLEAGYWYNVKNHILTVGNKYSFGNFVFKELEINKRVVIPEPVMKSWKFRINNLNN